MRTLLNLLVLAVILPLTSYSACTRMSRDEWPVVFDKGIANLFEVVEIQYDEAVNIPGEGKEINGHKSIHRSRLSESIRNRLPLCDPDPMYYPCLIWPHTFYTIKVTGTFGTLRRWWSKYWNGSPKKVMMNPANVMYKHVVKKFGKTREADIAELDKLLGESGDVYQYLQPGDDLCCLVDGWIFLVV